MLNKRGESGHPGLIPDLGGNVSFSLLSMMPAVGLSNMVFIMIYVPSMSTFWSFFKS